jgi:hypothetical protein
VEETMELAVIPPTPMLGHILAQPIHLCLAHLVLADDKYAEYYRNRRSEKEYVILDNSAYEFERSLSVEELMEASKKIQPSEFVLPDVMCNKDETVAEVIKALDAIQISIPFMAVPQGKNYYEWNECLEEILALGDPRIKTIGIPRVIDTWNRFRYPMIKMIPETMNIHLLGWAGGTAASVPLVIEKLYPKRVRSIDTAKPIHYALANQAITDMFYAAGVNAPTRGTDYFNTSWIDFGVLARRVRSNIEAMKGFVK